MTTSSTSAACEAAAIRSQLTITRMRSNRSAITPAYGLNSSIGMKRASVAAPTQASDPLRSYTTASSATLYAHDPAIDTSIAVSRRRRSRCARAVRYTRGEPIRDRGGRARVTTLHPPRWDDGPVPRPATAADLEAMTRVDGGSFLMGSEDFYPEEGPVRRVEVEGFWIDEHPVTVAEFRRIRCVVREG